jgi:hypothetical protein
MSPQEFDLIQRIRVEDGIPRLIATTIKVIEGGEDLLSQAIALLAQRGFSEKFTENRTSQYIGYKLKNPTKGSKRYQLILVPRKEGLCISLPEALLKPYLLELKHKFFAGRFSNEGDELYEIEFLGLVWVLPSKEDVFLNSMQNTYPDALQGELTGTRFLSYYCEMRGEIISMVDRKNFNIYELSADDSYLVFEKDKLFPYALQTCISSPKILEEFIPFFGEILMEQN